MIKDDFIINSGGAHGTDTFFSEVAASFGFNNTKHLYFEGFKTPNGNTPLSVKLAEEARPHVIEAARLLKRTFPTKNEYIDMLLLRNFFQVKEMSMVVAIGNLSEDSKEVEGGTGWAVEMAFILGIETYVFDLKSNIWYHRHFWKDFKRCSYTPIISDRIAGVGTREISKTRAESILVPLFEAALNHYKFLLEESV